MPTLPVPAAAGPSCQSKAWATQLDSNLNRYTCPRSSGGMEVNCFSPRNFVLRT